MARVEQVKRFRVLPTFREPGGDEVNLTMKLKRRPTAMKSAAETDGLYEPEIGKSVHEPKVAAQQPI